MNLLRSPAAPLTDADAQELVSATTAPRPPVQMCRTVNVWPRLWTPAAASLSLRSRHLAAEVLLEIEGCLGPDLNSHRSVGERAPL